MRSFNVVSGEGSQELAQEFDKCWCYIWSCIGPDHHASSQHNFQSMQKAKEKREVLAWRRKDALKNGDVSVSTNMWTDDCQKLSYVAITYHYVTHDFMLVSKTLTTTVFPVEDAKVGKKN